MRNLITQVRAALFTAQHGYKRNFDKRMRPVNKALKIGDWVFLDARDTNRRNSDNKIGDPVEIVRMDGLTYTALEDGLLDTVSSDHLSWAPPPTGQEPKVDEPEDPEAVVPNMYGPDDPAFIWDRFLDHVVDEEGNLCLQVRWWGYEPEEDTWERALKFDPRKVSQHCRRKHLPDPNGLAAFLNW